MYVNSASYPPAISGRGRILKGRFWPRSHTVIVSYIIVVSQLVPAQVGHNQPSINFADKQSQSIVTSLDVGDIVFVCADSRHGSNTASRFLLSRSVERPGRRRRRLRHYRSHLYVRTLTAA